MREQDFHRPPPSNSHFQILSPINPPTFADKSDESIQEIQPKYEHSTDIACGFEFIDVCDAVDNLSNPYEDTKIRALKYLKDVTFQNVSAARELRLFGGIQRLCCLLWVSNQERISPLVKLLANITSGQNKEVDEICSIIMESKNTVRNLIRHMGEGDCNTSAEIARILKNLSMDENTSEMIFKAGISSFDHILSSFVYTWSNPHVRGLVIKPGDAKLLRLGYIVKCLLNCAMKDTCRLALLSNITVPVALLEIVKISVIFNNINEETLTDIFEILKKLALNFNPEYFDEEKQDFLGALGFACVNLRRRKHEYLRNETAMFWISDVHTKFIYVMKKTTHLLYARNIIEIYLALTSGSSKFSKFYRQQIRCSDGLITILGMLEIDSAEVVTKVFRLLEILVEDGDNRCLIGFHGMRPIIHLMERLVSSDEFKGLDWIVQSVLDILYVTISRSKHFQVERSFIQFGGIRVLMQFKEKYPNLKKIEKILLIFWKNKSFRDELSKNGLIRRDSQKSKQEPHKSTLDASFHTQSPSNLKYF